MSTVWPPLINSDLSSCCQTICEMRLGSFCDYYCCCSFVALRKKGGVGNEVVVVQMDGSGKCKEFVGVGGRTVESGWWTGFSPLVSFYTDTHPIRYLSRLWFHGHVLRHLPYHVHTYIKDATQKFGEKLTNRSPCSSIF